MRASSDPVNFDAYARSYHETLEHGLALSGESREFFARARVEHVKHVLAGKSIRHVLDFGCGDGATSVLLASAFPDAEIVGTDVSAESIECARRHSSERIRFVVGHELLRSSRWRADLVYTNGVFHHIPPEHRDGTLQHIIAMLTPDGTVALWENNSWNPGTRLVMRRIPFDRDAIPLSPRVMRRLVTGNRLKVERMDFLFYFPRALAFLRRTEAFLRHVPLGAQYCAFCRLDGREASENPVKVSRP